MTAPDTLAADWREMRSTGFMARIGQLLARKSPEGWVYGLRADAGHLNAVGLVHGGVITTLVDHAVALVAWEVAGRRPVVTVQAETRYLAPAREGELIEVRARLRHQARSLLYLDAEVSAQGGLVASGSAIMKIAGNPAEVRHD